MLPIQAIRSQFPVLQREVYLNAGTNGPLPRCVVETLIELAREELDEGRIGQKIYDRSQARTAETRALVAELLACSPDEIALTHNTTEGMNIALMGLDWHPGDELITATSEHEGGLNPSALLKARYGVRVVYSDIGMCDCDPLETLQRTLTARTRAVVLSHVSWATGAILPLGEICDMAHRVGALVVCDAAQACGMIPTRLPELDVDAYAISGQKWLCGPDGVGALYVRRDLIPKIQNTFTSYWGIKTRVARADAAIEFGETAQRYQVAAHFPPAVAAFAAGLVWIRDEIGWDWVYRRTMELAQYAYDSLSALGATLYLPRERISGLLHFKIEGIPPADLTARLYEQNILIRHTPEPELNRVSTGFYNTEDDLDHLCDAIRTFIP